MRDPTFMPTGGAIGFSCRHLYEEAALSSTERKLKSQTTGSKPVSAQAIKLKNEDAVIAVTASSFGLQVRVLRVMTHDYSAEAGETYLLSKMPKKSQLKKLGFSRRSYGWQSWYCDDDHIRAFAAGTIEEDEANVVWVDEDSGPQKTLCDREYSATGYFGNEACGSTFYSSARIVVDIPPTTARATLLRSPAPLSGEDLRTRQQQKAHEEAVRAGARPELYPYVEPPTPTVTKSRGTGRAATASAAASVTSGPRTILIQESSAQIAPTKRKSLECEDGFIKVVLFPGEGLRDLKKRIRKMFGKVRCQKLGALMMVDGARAAKTTNLVDGVKLRCTYTYASGNMRNPYGGGRRRGRWMLSTFGGNFLLF